MGGMAPRWLALAPAAVMVVAVWQCRATVVRGVRHRVARGRMRWAEHRRQAAELRRLRAHDAARADLRREARRG